MGLPTAGAEDVDDVLAVCHEELGDRTAGDGARAHPRRVELWIPAGAREAADVDRGSTPALRSLSTSSSSACAPEPIVKA
jgi:hypothetical protein